MEKSGAAMDKISVVLPCANESYVQRTVESIWANTPKEELLEIIIVDDASWPPVTSSKKSTKMDRYGLGIGRG